MSNNLYNNTIDVEYTVAENTTSTARTAQIFTEYDGEVVDVMTIQQEAANTSSGSGNNPSTPDNPSTPIIPDIDLGDISAADALSKIQECRKLLDTTDYETAYQLALTTIDSYLNRERDEYGCVLINEDEQYPLDNVNLYYDSLETMLSNYDAVNLFYAELTGQLAELKISRVRKVLNALEQAYDDLKKITEKNQALTESIINGWKDDSVISIEEQNQLKQKYDEICSEYEPIMDNVLTLIEIYEGLIADDKTAFIKEDVVNYVNTLKPAFENYDASYEQSKAVLEYYINFPESGKNELGGIPVNPEYDLIVLTEFYKNREKLLNVYYEANAYYTTYNRFGSKTVWIGEDGLYAGTISADNIRGWNIEGLTMGSGKYDSNIPDYVKWEKYRKNEATDENDAFETMYGGVGPGWQLRRDGDGHIAGGQISWNAEGNVTLGKNVTISYSQIPDADENIDPKFDNIRDRISALRDELIDKINGVGDGDDSDRINQQDLDNLQELITAQYQLALAALKAELHDADDENRRQIEQQIKTAESKLSDANAAIAALKASLENLKNNGTDEDDNTGSVLDESAVRQIMAAALIDSTFWTDDMIGSETVMGRHVIGLVGNFGWLKASSISGDLISGKTFQSDDKADLKAETKYETFGTNEYGDVSNGIQTAGSSTKGPTWQLRRDGSGYLGRGGITWDANGDIKMNGVKMSWYDISDKPTIPEYDDSGNLEPSKFKSIIFKRSNETPNDYLTGGTWNNPYPDNRDTLGWSDGIPSGDGKIWMSYKIFKSDDSQTDDWSTPQLMVDSESFEVAYATAEAISDDYAISEGLPKDNFGNAVQNENGEFTFTHGWTDEPDPNGDKEYVFMATANCDNGKWGKWTVSRIKGEDGKAGTSISVVGAFDTLDEFKANINQNTAPANLSDCYVVAGDLYVWDSINNKWKNVGKFKGDAGETYYLHIKYAKSANVDDTGTAAAGSIVPTEGGGENTKDAKWIGIAHSLSDLDPEYTDSRYKWTRFVSEPEPVLFKSIVFTRAISGVDISGAVPTGGTYSNPKPNDTVYNGATYKWSDGVPAALEGTDGGVIWSSYKTFISNGDYSNPSKVYWSNPSKMLDEPGKFETAYGTALVLVNNKIDESGLPTANGEIDGPANPDGGFSKGWYDEPENIPTGQEAVYMATATCTAGVWSPWHILKVKGERGDKGAGIKYTDTLNYITDLPLKPASEDEAYIIKVNPKDPDDTSWNHLFAWTGVNIDGNTGTYDPDKDDLNYRGWGDTGKFNGSDGKDGASTFKSTVFIRSNVKPTAAPSGGDYASPKPTSTHDGKSWSDGIPTGTEILWASTATFSTDTSKNVSWSVPSQMTDNEYFEVVYSSNLEKPSITKLYRDADGEGITNWIKENNNNWTDDPDGEDSIWMAQAKCDNGVWGEWTISKIKGEKGSDGASTFKSSLFKRSDKALTSADKPTGGSYSDPTPSGTGWYDSVPAGNEILWMSTRTFSTDSSKQDAAWSDPKAMTDNPDFEVIYSSKENPTAPKSGFSKDADDNISSSWLSSNPHWTDEPSSTETPIWMATIKKHEGKWGSWSVSKIKGEKGEDAYVYIKYATNIEYTDSTKKTLNVSKCTCTANGGEMEGPWMGVGHGSDPNDPVIDKTATGYSDSNWSIYKWSKIQVDDIETAVETALGTYNISSNHMSGKTMDNDVTDGVLNYDTLPTGLKYELFEKETGEDGRLYDTGKSKMVTVGTDKDYSGKTVTKGPAWQIRNDGTGHLAKGNIVWDDNGNLYGNFNGSFDGGGNGTLAGGAITWNDTEVQVHKNFKFDTGVGISWSNVSGAPDYATKDYVDQNSGGFTTEIGNNWIKTADVTCEKLKVQNLQTKSSSTTTNKNNIVATGNTLNAYNTKSQPALTVTGNSFSRIQPIKNVAYKSSSSQFSDSSNGHNSIYTIFTWTVLSSYSDATIIVPDVELYVEGSISGNGQITGSYYYTITDSNGTLVESYAYNSVKSTATSTSSYGNNTTVTGSTVKLSGFTRKVNSGKTYNVNFHVKYGGTAEGTTFSINVMYTKFKTDLVVTGNYGIDRTDIGENGFRVCHDSSHIVEFAEYNNSGSYMIYSDNYGIKISDTAMFLKLANQWYRTGVKTISGTNVLALTSVSEETVLGNDSNIDGGNESGSGGSGSYAGTAAIWEDEEGE